MVGYSDNPAALPTRALALGLALRGHDVRVVEERQNHAFVETLREHGSGSSRHFHTHFAALQHITWETRTGARLLEWATRELALIDVAVAVAGLNDELCQWIANINRERLTRVYLTWEPEALTVAEADRLMLTNFELILAPRKPKAKLPWSLVTPALAAADADAGLAVQLHASLTQLADPLNAAKQFERVLSQRPLAVTP